ncbi:MAG: hypothetical protein H6821_00465 [Planctomycetaceae bacterium]|nr:hypothetical protein [Planctomycetales bacterium]MCB9872623.1 hypothetical protein [Planctomycetaceae bacterium]
MARHEQDREDLMREATALVRRVELQVPGGAEPCVAGFRRGGEVSIFVGADPVFQFNNKHELRRGFWNGRLIKAERGVLVQLERRRMETEVQLVRTELSESLSAEYLRLAGETLRRLQRARLSDELVVLQQIPDDKDVVAELASWLEMRPERIAVASAPNVEA